MSSLVKCTSKIVKAEGLTFLDGAAEGETYNERCGEKPRRNGKL